MAPSTTASAQFIAIGPSALATHTSTAPAEMCASSKSTSAHCTYAKPRPSHRRRTTFAAASGTVPRTIKTPPRAEFPLDNTSSKTHFNDAYDDTSLSGVSLSNTATTTGANADATARALTCARAYFLFPPLFASRETSTEDSWRSANPRARSAASLAALALANASLARAWSPRRTAASPLAMSAAGE